MSNRTPAHRSATTMPPAVAARYRVEWSTLVDAASHQAAAEIAAAIIRTMGGDMAVRQCDRTIASGQMARAVRVTVPGPPATVPSDICRRVSDKPAKSARPATNARMDGRAFAAAFATACQAVKAELGPLWSLMEGSSVLLDVPAALRSYKTDMGVTVRMRRDHRAPAPRFWPGGELPAGPVVVADYPRAGSETYSDDYDKWLKAWKATPAAHHITESQRFHDWLLTLPDRGNPGFRYDATPTESKT